MLNAKDYLAHEVKICNLPKNIYVWACARVNPIRIIHKMILCEVFCLYRKIVP